MRAYNLLCAVAMCDCESVSPSLPPSEGASERARARARGRRSRSVGQSLDVAPIALGRHTSLPNVAPSQMHLTRLSLPPSLVQ